jgi:hypothetical protein
VPRQHPRADPRRRAKRRHQGRDHVRLRRRRLAAQRLHDGQVLLQAGHPGVLADKARGEAQLKPSGLDWTLAYPVTLNNKPATGFTATPLDSTPKLSGMPSISRADVAAFLLNTAVNGTYTRQTVTLRTAK